MIIDAQSSNPKLKKSTANYVAIHELSQKFLSDIKALVRPDAHALIKYGSESGAITVAFQTLKNRYRNMIAIWKDAHTQLVNIFAQGLLKERSKRKSGGPEADMVIQMLEDAVRALYLENVELREQLGHKAPSLSPDTASTPAGEAIVGGEPDYVLIKPFRDWLESLTTDRSYLIPGPTGLTLSKTARPTVTIIKKDVYEVMQKLAG
ncbi:hypothetical protein [Rhizobium sp. BK176]|uniref:hypothetical protein n=1 Tax=Rhizobium sp. BK176 TaxID=2587071 RepID=UPI00216A46F5|nr:hypothetical protein [Rhizobium sp. BK176]MCS4091356.1 hypothetical protein [Rhizobium sp. BK176]